MPTNLNSALYQSLKGGFRDYQTTGAPEFLKLAPIVKSDKYGQYNYFTDVARLDDRNAPYVGSDAADFLSSNFSIERGNFQTKRVVGHSFIIPNDVAATLTDTASIDVVNAAIVRGVRPLFGKMVSDFVTEATSALSSAGTVDLTNQAENYIEKVLGYCDAVELATGKRPNFLYVGPVAANLMRLLDEVQSGVAISGYTDAGSAVRRTGMHVTHDVLKEWHRYQLGVELVIERESKTGSAGTGSYIVGTTGVLAVAGSAGGVDNAMITAVKTAGRSADLVDFVVRETGVGQAVGLGVDCDAYYKIEAVGPDAGRTITFTLA